MPSDPSPPIGAEKSSIVSPVAAGRRLGAAAIDGALAAVFVLLGVGLATLLAGPCVGPGCELIFGFGVVGAAGALGLVQAFLIGIRGQSIGKRVTGLRVVRADGQPAGVVRGALLRTLPLVLVPALLFGVGEAIWEVASADADTSVLVRAFGYNGLSNLLTVAPAIGSAAFVLADAIAAFLPGGRALHDRIAGTRVTRALSLEEAAEVP